MKKTIEFDYLGHKNITENFFGSQKDWNQLLLTKINQCIADKNKKSYNLYCPNKFKNLIDSLEHYWDFKINLSHCKIYVSFTDDETDLIQVDGENILIKNFNESKLT